MALLYVSAVHGVELAGVSTVAGNCPLDDACANTLRVLELIGLGGVPLHRGAAGPLRGPATHAAHVHGTDGLGGLRATLPRPRGVPRPEPAADAIRRACRARPGEVTLVATGPLTNLAAAASDPELPRLVRQVVVMGGAVSAPGNVGAVVEFNIGFDPEAARAVLSAAWPLTLVPLDVTMRVLVEGADVGRLEEAGTPGAAFAAAALRQYMAAYAPWIGRSAAPLHDPLALAVALDPSLVRTAQVPLDVETRGELTRGMVVADRRSAQPPVGRGGKVLPRLCVEVDAPRAVRRLLDAWGAAGSGSAGR